MTELAEEKKSSRKRKTVTEGEEQERKSNPKRAAKTKAEEQKAAAVAAAAAASSSSNVRGKKKQTEKEEGPGLPKLKEFLANAQDLHVVIAGPQVQNGEVSEEKGEGEGGEEKETSNAVASKNGNSVSSETLYTLNAKPQKHSTGSYGWTASNSQAKIKVEIDGKVVELPATININITVQGSKK